MPRVVVVDSGLCNLDSIRRALEECGATVTVTDDGRDLSGADQVVLPGVGSFPGAMRALRERALEEPLRETVLGEQIPFLGVCLGMQLLLSLGHEGAETAGLGWINGEVCRLEPSERDRRIPHV